MTAGTFLQLELEPPPALKLGDASIAAAFTAKSASVSSCVDIVRQGRCTLVTTTQMFKILALNCLVSAYGLSVLHLRGVRIGDTQATATGLSTAATFLFLSFSRPLPKLSPKRPPSSVLAPAVLSLVLGQFGVHLYVLISAVSLAEAHSRGPPPEVDAEFEPTLPNTIVWHISSAMLLVTFAVNYKGRPFMEPLSANKWLMATLVLSAAVLAALMTGAAPDLEDYLELVPLDSEVLRSDLGSLVALDLAACWGVEKLMSLLSGF